MTTIKELKEYLASLPPEMDESSIMSTISIGCCGDTLELGDVELDHISPDKTYGGCLHLRFYPDLAGYRSCRQVGLTEKTDKEYWKQFPASSHYKTLFGEEK